MSNRRFITDRRAFSPFARARRAEETYARQLRKVAWHIGDIVAGFPAGSIEALRHIEDALGRYAKLIEPWATATATRMVTEVDRRNQAAWVETTRQIGAALREEIATAPTGLALRRLLAENVALITSLPTEAVRRVHTLTLEGITQGRRAAEIAAEIDRTGEVTKSRAMLIARTEVARTGSLLTETRAQHAGCTHYVWRTAGDSDVRKSHREMAGKVVAFSEPPLLDGLRGHAGQLPNCRCYMEVILSSPR